jgi:hypothetical protein
MRKGAYEGHKAEAEAIPSRYPLANNTVIVLHIRRNLNRGGVEQGLTKDDKAAKETVGLSSRRATAEGPQGQPSDHLVLRPTRSRGRSDSPLVATAENLLGLVHIVGLHQISKIPKKPQRYLRG